ncbi:MAG: MarR family transcriptional regulator [Candidatus Accumulibacter sp.]|nr:MarR family transcriptional regulator [Accumulibacter sp.]MBA4093349.1 MarR family transcriptional regulator [Accumulibacter sp.]
MDAAVSTPADSSSPAPTEPLSKHDFELLADFRYQVRKFVRFSEELARQHGITPLQYLLLLHVKGYPGRDWATVGELAERLQAQHHGVVALVTRCVKQGFVERRRSQADKRQIEIHLRDKGAAILDELARLHRAELLSLQGRFVVPDLRAFAQG